MFQNIFSKKLVEDDISRFIGEHDLADSTQATYRRIFTYFIGEVPNPAKLTAEGFKRWLSKDTWGNSMRWVAFCSIRKFLQWHYGSQHPALSLKINRKSSPPQRTPSFRTIGMLFSYLENLGDTPKSIRDRALVALLLDSGLRASEICRLTVNRLDINNRHLDVLVKGGKWGEAVFSGETAEYLQKWLEIRAGVVFPGVSTVFIGVGGVKPGRPLTRQGLTVIVRKWGKQAGIGQISPHDFRRAFATLSTLRGAPERIAMKAGRWTNAEVFSLYTRGIKASDFDPYFPTKAILDRK